MPKRDDKMSKQTYTNERLTIEEFSSCLEIFTQLVERGLNARYSKTVEQIQEWMRQVSLSNIHLLLKSDSLESLVSTVFSDDDVRDFVKELHFKFFSLAQTSSVDFTQKLCNNFVDAMMLDGAEKTWSILPEQLREFTAMGVFEQQSSEGLLSFWKRKPKEQKLPEQQLFLFLMNNRFILIIMLIYLTFVTEGTQAQTP